MKTNTKDMDMERMEKLAAEIERNPLTKKFREDESAETLATRQEAAGKLEVLGKEQGEVIPKLRKAVEEKEAKYLKVKADLDAAGGELQRARGELSSENNNFDTAIRILEAGLIESADSCIGGGITFFTEKLAFLRSPGRISQTAGGSERNIFTMKKTVKEESNVDAINSALQYCMAAIKELERMKLTPALDAEKIERMKAGIPDIDVYTEVTGEKPMEKINTDRILKWIGSWGN